MGVDSSMIIRNDFRDTGKAEDRMAYIRKMEDKLLRRYAIKNRERWLYEYEEDFRFRFNIYDVVSINLYNGLWEIETAFTYNQYLSGDVRAMFADIARDFGAKEVYICSEHCTWNGEDMDSHTMESWLKRMEERFGPIRRFNPVETPKQIDDSLPEVFLEDFADFNDEYRKIEETAEPLGMEATGITGLGDRFLLFRKGEELFCYDEEDGNLFIDEPIDAYENFNGLGFGLCSDGKETVYSNNGIPLISGKEGSFNWKYSDSYRERCGIGKTVYEIMNFDTGDNVFIIDRREWHKDENLYYYFRKYENKCMETIIEEYRL